MEILTSDKGISREVDRQLLMAISQSVPEKLPGPKALVTNPCSTNVIKFNRGGGDEECRSKPISTSYMQSMLEVARESLIAISQSIPDNVLLSTMLPKISTRTNVVEFGGGGGEESRLELISISSMQSHDLKFLLSSLESRTT